MEEKEKKRRFSSHTWNIYSLTVQTFLQSTNGTKKCHLLTQVYIHIGCDITHVTNRFSCTLTQQQKQHQVTLWQWIKYIKNTLLIPLSLAAISIPSWSYIHIHTLFFDCLFCHLMSSNWVDMWESSTLKKINRFKFLYTFSQPFL